MNLRYTKRILCLANSRKQPSGRCIAGRELTAVGFGRWIRPVSARPTHEIAFEERRYKHGKEPRVLDVLSIAKNRPQPQQHQQENHLIDARCVWAKQGAMGWNDLQFAVETPVGPLWLNGHSSSHGENDRVPDSCVAGLTRSLYLIRPEQLRLVVGSETSDFSPPRRRVRARFILSGHSYSLVVTDPYIENEYFAKGDGETAVDDALLCVSLGDMFHGFAYKLSAAVITPQRART